MHMHGSCDRSVGCACMRFQVATGDRAQRFNKMVVALVDMVFDSIFLSFFLSGVLLLPSVLSCSFVFAYRLGG